MQMVWWVFFSTYIPWLPIQSLVWIAMIAVFLHQSFPVLHKNCKKKHCTFPLTEWNIFLRVLPKVGNKRTTTLTFRVKYKSAIATASSSHVWKWVRLSSWCGMNRRESVRSNTACLGCYAHIGEIQFSRNPQTDPAVSGSGSSHHITSIMRTLSGSRLMSIESRQKMDSHGVRGKNKE